MLKNQQSLLTRNLKPTRLSLKILEDPCRAWRKRLGIERHLRATWSESFYYTPLPANARREWLG